MDLAQNHLCREVRGVAARTDTVLQAFFSGAVDEATNDLATGIQGAGYRRAGDACAPHHRHD